jgi:hypothetical protein
MFAFVAFDASFCAGGQQLTAAEFDTTVAPVLARHCLSCHNSSDRKGGLDLTRSETLTTGGESGPVVSDRNPDESPLYLRVASGEMPPPESKLPPVSAEEQAILRTWIASGSPWGTSPVDMFRFSTTTRAGADWWSLQPVTRPSLPEVADPAWCKKPVDFFVLSELESHQLSPAPPADRETWIRRLYFDLIGLPPSPAEIDAYVSSTDPKADDKLIDHLLSSPHYGERWARHWLDVARYTESQGFEYDRFRPNAWHYRDYVIQSLNQDKPYNIFLQEQLAGDVVNFASPDSPVTPEGIIASSLLVCGPWDQAGNAQANVTQRKITREEEQEDLVAVVSQTFLGLTVNCARCHAHKFDPVTQEDYYRFRAVFDGIRHGERSVETPEEAARRQQQLESLQSVVESTERRLAEIEQTARAVVLKSRDNSDAVTAPPMARWTFDSDARDSVGSLHGELQQGATIREGRLVLNGNGQFLRTAPLSKNLTEKTLEAWILLSSPDQGGGGALSVESAGGGNFDAIVFAERQPRKWMAGSAGFARTQDLSSAPEEVLAEPALIHMVIVYRSDNSIAVYRNGLPYGESYRQGSLQTYAASTARVLMGLRHTGAGNGFLKGEVESASLYDRALVPDEVAASFAAGHAGGPVVTQEEMLAALTVDQKAQRDLLLQELRSQRDHAKALSRPRVSYVGLREQPEPARRLNRGNVISPAEVVTPAGLNVIRTPVSDFGLPPDAPEGERRVHLARWMADPQHPLTARVMVNRIWQYHFGRGIVETPSDFGFNGARPSHPKLLDWLAAEFVSGPAPWSIRHIHKQILMSSTFRQSSAFNEKAALQDADNSLLWRYSPRRLEGEIVRDAMLAVSGQLNPAVGGPSFRPFTVTNHGSDFYHLADMIGPEFNRRTIYRAHINSGKSSMMDSLDCPDPSIKTPARRVTTTPLAALALMNNSFVQRQAKHLTERVVKETPGTPSGDPNSSPTAQINYAWRLCLGRLPSVEERISAQSLVQNHGLETLCWSLLNASEFVYVD